MDDISEVRWGAGVSYWKKSFHKFFGEKKTKETAWKKTI